MNYNKLNIDFLYNIDKKLKQKRKKNDNDYKLITSVLDRSTLLSLSSLIQHNIISYINGVSSAGKESVLFWAVDGNKNNIALKIYLIGNSNFKKRSLYMNPIHYKNVKNNRHMINLWAKKEFQNLKRCITYGIPVVKPICVLKNILVMDFIGKNGMPNKTLVKSDVNQNDYHSLIYILTKMYTKAGLIHADLSEFNIFKTDTGLVLFDLSSAIDLHHPTASFLLHRDICNITKFFLKRGLIVDNPIDVFNKIVNAF